jgi:hypothetical protein
MVNLTVSLVTLNWPAGRCLFKNLGGDSGWRWRGVSSLILAPEFDTFRPQSSGSGGRFAAMEARQLYTTTGHFVRALP